MALALYRKYRSRNFADLVGQEHVTDVLESATKNNRISHAYLFTGPRGVGKTSAARILARQINQLDYSQDGSVLDIIEIDAASNNSVEDIRDLREKVHIAPVNSSYKVYIIDEVHMLSGAAFNALLKTLEEPPEHAVFVLATTELDKVPATILSRTQRFAFKPASIDALKSHLKMIAKKEAINVDDEALELIASQAEGSFRDGVSLLDQLSNLADKIDAKLVEATLGLAPSALIEQLVNSLEQKNLNDLLGQLQTVSNQAIAATTLTDQLIAQLTKLGLEKPDYYRLISQLLEVRQSQNPLMKLTAILVSWLKPDRSAANLVAPEVTYEASVKSKPRHRTTDSANLTQPEPEPEAKAEPETNPELTAKKTAKPQSLDFNWDKLLTKLNTRHTSLCSVLKRAEADYNATTNTLNLGFLYKLHSKKLEQNTYKQQLVSELEQTCGIKPILNIYLQAKPTKTTNNSAAEAVIDIMGGGEIVK